MANFVCIYAHMYEEGGFLICYILDWKFNVYILKNLHILSSGNFILYANCLDQFYSSWNLLEADLFILVRNRAYQIWMDEKDETGERTLSTCIQEISNRGNSYLTWKQDLRILTRNIWPMCVITYMESTWRLVKRKLMKKVYMCACSAGL